MAINVTVCIYFRFVEKQIRLENVKRAIGELNNSAEVYFKTLRYMEDLKHNIESKKKNIALLRQVVQEARNGIVRDKERYEKTAKANSNLAFVLPRYEDKVKKLEDYVLAKRDEVNASQQKHHENHAELKVEVTANVDRLVRYVFPIRKVVSGQDDDDVIAEATRTVCVRGKWQVQESSEGSYIIVAPFLPGDGDYNIYNDWVMANRESLPHSSLSNETLISNCAYRICAALTYTAQLVQLLSYYLGVRLPFKLNYCDFCRIDMPEQKFNRNVNRLNANILYICYTQRIKLGTLNPAHTLENLYKLLVAKQGDLGRRGNNELALCLPEHIDQKLVHQLNKGGDDSESDEDSDESTLAHEWESIPQAIATDFNVPQSAMPNQPNFVTSLTSIFRWTTGK